MNSPDAFVRANFSTKISPALIKRHSRFGSAEKSSLLQNSDPGGTSAPPVLSPPGLPGLDASPSAPVSQLHSILRYPEPPAFKLGNLLLSSCPGKKVRLSGPVKGRGGVCRDLGADLARVKELGVGCIVCCLDDEELEFLGASWSEYSRVAHEVGLDVLRIPTPEGLAPLTPHLLDSYLSELIKTYTLHNIPILVHCRGGVGRAGLVACCWILKLGLCGWIETDPRPHESQGVSVEVRRDTMQLVERVIAVVRRRRSVKAVETYEQVKFLVDFVEYLRDQANPVVVGSGLVADLIL
ncbi:hypothetical protein JAAARDRAFT_130821 [Jaapia argillacea MUCL 33604]|uniref:Tyrosine specific protein phosphatases domain-containing protein n=1 Tax=Jaapia argillacea MUCL 33604 TaxID=933084 RepID=A0A067PSL3_9AGAM|nr:hypothetical protein JAAARDRAFT_130821 [Jaapia argillacea MUCL 33604]